jgi:predicted amidohydrolase YtcJ
MLVPGFQDAHVHPSHGGDTLLTCNLSEVVTLDEALALITAYAAAEAGDWIWGGGWRFNWFEGGMPSVELLDSLIPDRPAYFRVADGHAGWANTKAFEAAGIDPTTPDPSGGRIERKPDGTPQGTLQESAMDLVERLRVLTSTDVERALLRGQEYLIAFGITAWQDAQVDRALHDAYVRTEADGRLQATVRGAQWWAADAGFEQFDEFEARRAEASGRYNAGSVKLMLDGVVENFTARMLDSYLDGHGHETGNTGMDFINPTELPRIVTEVMRRGFQPHFHALGDRAVRSALDAVEVARTELGWTDVRPHLAHLQAVHPDDVPRFRALGVIVNAQPFWACAEDSMSDLTLPFINEPTANRQYPFRSLRAAGASIAMGSDWSVSTPEVMQQIDVAVRREVIWDRSVPAFLPEERLDIADALVAFTAGSAYASHLESERGTIAVGAVADLAVLESSPFEADDIAAIRVDQTYIDGRRVFSRRDGSA